MRKLQLFYLFTALFKKDRKSRAKKCWRQWNYLRNQKCSLFFLLIIPVWLFYGLVAVVVVVFTLEERV